MSTNCGLPVQQCKEFIKQYYTRYARVAEWQKENITEVKNSRVSGGGTTSPLGYPTGVGTLQSRTGRRYCFREHDVPTNMQMSWEKDANGVQTQTQRYVDFSPTMIKNYPVEHLGGFAK